MLPLLVPFLELSSNQEYLVKRIKELAKSSCITDYRWNSGSSFNGIAWDEHLPTDSAVIKKKSLQEKKGTGRQLICFTF
jgi:hypothetical protein